jgi:hypothetical protein
MGYLYGQGQNIDAGPPWEEVVFPLRPYGGAGGGFICRRKELGDCDDEDDAEEQSQLKRRLRSVRRTTEWQSTVVAFTKAVLVDVIPGRPLSESRERSPCRTPQCGGAAFINVPTRALKCYRPLPRTTRAQSPCTSLVLRLSTAIRLQ